MVDLWVSTSWKIGLGVLISAGALKRSLTVYEILTLWVTDLDLDVFTGVLAVIVHTDVARESFSKEDVPVEKIHIQKVNILSSNNNFFALIKTHHISFKNSPMHLGCSNTSTHTNLFLKLCCLYLCLYFFNVTTRIILFSLVILWGDRFLWSAFLLHKNNFIKIKK